VCLLHFLEAMAKKNSQKIHRTRLYARKKKKEKEKSTTDKRTVEKSDNGEFIANLWKNIFVQYNQQDATFLKFIYFCNMLYMFQTVFPSIIRRAKLHIQRQVFVRPLLLPAASLRLAAGSSNGLTNT